MNLVTRAELPHPTFTNAHAQMCAVITALTNVWGDDAQELIRRTYRALGARTGQQMIDIGIVPPGADLETYGRVSEQIMDTCGLQGWTRLTSDAPDHRTAVPGCASYVPLFKFLGAPGNVCALPFEWDNGCLDVINPDLEVWPQKCAYQGAADCHYVISHRQSASHNDAVGTAQPQTEATVQDQPTWTNPTAGFLALIGAAEATFGHEARTVLRPALHALGARAGVEDFGAVNPTATAARFLAERYAAAGFPAADIADASNVVDINLGRNPYGPVLDLFGSRPMASDLFAAYDAGWVEAATGTNFRIHVLADSWQIGGDHRLQIVERSSG